MLKYFFKKGKLKKLGCPKSIQLSFYTDKIHVRFVLSNERKTKIKNVEMTSSSRKCKANFFEN